MKAVLVFIGSRKERMSFYFIVVVWGDAYVDMLLQVALRCYLSPRNIPGLHNLSTSKFIFVSTQEDYAKISASKIHKKLAQYLEPIFIEMDATEDNNCYAKATLGFEKATRLACQNQAYAIYLLPDGLVSDGTFCRLEYYAEQGRDVVLLPGPRVIKEKALSYINALNLEDDAALSFEPRKLAALGLEILHPEFKHYNYTAQAFTKWPHMVTWNIPGQVGLLVRAFHLHPLMVNCANALDFNKDDTIDGHFIKRNFLDLNKFLLETDSDHMILYSMTEENERDPSGLVWSRTDKLKAILAMAQQHPMINELHKIYFYNAYKLHADELGKEWAEQERESFKMVTLALQSKPKKVSLYLRLRKRVLDTLPSIVRSKLRQNYWKLQERISWFKSKLFA
jgi:hypothetical protein